MEYHPKVSGAVKLKLALAGQLSKPKRKTAEQNVSRATADHLSARRNLRAQPLLVFVMERSLGGLVTTGSVVRD